MEEKMNALAELLEREPGFADRLADMSTEEGLAALAAEGVAVTYEEMAEVARALAAISAQTGELGEDVLDDVSGGVAGPVGVMIRAYGSYVRWRDDKVKKIGNWLIQNFG